MSIRQKNKLKLINIVIFTIFLLIFLTNFIFSQENKNNSREMIDFSGTVLNGDLYPIANVEVVLIKGEKQIAKTTSNEKGKFIFNDIKKGFYLLELVLKVPDNNFTQAIIEIEVNENLISKEFQVILGSSANPIKAKKDKKIIDMSDTKKEKKELDEIEYEYQVKSDKDDVIVVTGSLTEHTLRGSPVRTTIIDREKFERTSSHSLADVLAFSTGVRTENNCQHCNYNQVRLNGLDGSYSQILIDGMPIIGSLASGYGLEQIPLEMVEKIEIVKGGASALYSGSAIGGVINVITKAPEKSFYLMSYDQSWYDKNTPDIRAGVIASEISDDKKIGGVAYGSFQYRKAYFHDDDEFSENSQLRNSTLGGNFYYNLINDARLKFGFSNIKENRRGGDKLNYPEHEANIASSIKTDMYIGLVTWEHILNKYFAYKLYASSAITNKNTYYGVNLINDAYGRTENPLWLSGINLLFPFKAFGEHLIIVGGEYKNDKLKDEYLTYGRKLDVEYENIGAFLQEEWTIFDGLKILAGIRMDKHSEIDHIILNPRGSVLYNIIDPLTFRLTFSTGHRAPVIFDKDLHIAQVRGTYKVIENSDDLKEEHSISVTGGFDYEETFGDIDFRAAINGFYTRLKDLFVLIQDESVTDYLLYYRENASKAEVYGGEIEFGFMYNKYVSSDIGFTIQQAKLGKKDKYNQDNMYRTPNSYGYFVLGLNYMGFELSGTGVFTGKMKVLHMTSSGTVLEKSDNFFDLGAKLAYNLKMKMFHETDPTELKLYIGIKNILNSYQDDFDTGISRHAGYVYGPRFPRTYYCGAQLKF